MVLVATIGSTFKSFLISEQHHSKIELRVETFNTWNHTEFQNVFTGFSGYNSKTGVANGNFGQVSSTWESPRVPTRRQVHLLIALQSTKKRPLELSVAFSL